ncbi:MAG TPA: GldG family protein [Bryobacteraceae bacterium]|nr:GldG family protein [Bryobacteraceae bacterium]
MANWMKARQTKYTAYVSLYIVVIVAVLAAANFLANRYDKSYDATKNKQFTLSDQTIKVVKGLKAPVKITYFDSQTNFPTARNLLERYANLSTKVHVDYIDPVKKPQQARAAGFSRDSNIIVDTGFRKEPAKALTEEEVTGALIRAEKTQTKTVYFLSAGGEYSTDDSGPTGYSRLKDLLTKDNYKVQVLTPKGNAPEAGKTINLNEKQPQAPSNFEIPKDCTVLVVGGPQLAYTPAVVDAIKKYVEGGGHALFMLDDPLKISREGQTQDSPELIKLLSDWGVTPDKDLVVDLSGVGQGLFGTGPEVPVIFQYDQQKIVSVMQRVPTAFPLSRSLDIKSTSAATVDKMFGTSDDSLAVTDIGANGAIDPKKGKKGPFTLAAAGTTTGTTKGRFVVYGTARWAQNNLMNSNALGNRDLFNNTINWLSADEDLISIRPKEIENQTMNLTGQRGAMMFWLSIVIFPLAVVGMGLGTWWQRR